MGGLVGEAAAVIPPVAFGWSQGVVGVWARRRPDALSPPQQGGRGRVGEI